jgi:CBS domain-containing protein
MAMWQVENVMAKEVITAPDTASLAEVAAAIAEHRITAVPIVDRFDAVVGVVSWTDLQNKIDLDEPGKDGRSGGPGRWAPTLLRWPAGTAAEVMSAPPLTIELDASLPAAARLMYRRKVGRLLVVDDTGRLRGIVTRTDLLKVHARLDAVIRDEVMQQVLRGVLVLEPGAVHATVDDGVVTLAGRMARRTSALAAVRMTEAVAGVTRVVDRLGFDIEDTVAAPTSEPVEVDPLHDWWVGRQLAEPAGRTAEDLIPRQHDPQTARSVVLP